MAGRPRKHMTDLRRPARVWRVGTRGSRLARAQTRSVIDQLQERFPQERFEPVVIRTAGDADRTRDLAQFDAVGVFVKELERALLTGEVDLVVHSAKDLPTLGPEELAVAAFPRRGWTCDLLLCREPWPVDPATGLPALPEGSRVGTASVRRRAQVAAWRPDLRLATLRGNVDTRLRRLAEGEYDGIVLAAAGLARLGLLPGGGAGGPGPAGQWMPLSGLESLHAYPLPLDRFVPAPGQGALAVQVRAGDEAVMAMAAGIDDPATSVAVRAERAFLAGMGSSCAVPIGAVGRVAGETLELLTYYAGAEPTHRHWTGPSRLPEDLGRRAARAMLPPGE
ncbi:MAG TPA: hydroxymethylbilane synthase [Bacillota bacterium]